MRPVICKLCISRAALNIALIDSNPKPVRYNVGLLKIASFLKSVGYECDFYQNKVPTKKYDNVWISTIFTFNIPHAIEIARSAEKISQRVLVGGIAATLMPEEFSEFDIYSGLFECAEEFPPDYSLLKSTPRYSIAMTSRGCIRKCKFCMVSKLEPEFVDRPNWPNDIHRASKEIIFYDNNFLAKPEELVKRDIESLVRICSSGRINLVDFNQALDCRLLTEEYASLLRDIPLKPVRFAFDNMSEDGHLQEAVKRMSNVGFKRFMIYTLWNYLDTPQDLYYRLREIHKLSQDLGVQVESFPMRYQPILQIDEKREYIGPNWTERQKKAFSASLMYIGATHGQISLFGKKGGLTPVKNFEFWYGRSEEEFVEILNKENMREYWRFKKGVYMAHSTDVEKPQSWFDFWSEIST